LSYPLFYVLDSVFGGSVTAIKSFIVLLSLLYFVYLRYVFRIPVPSFDISLKHDSRKAKSVSGYYTQDKQVSSVRDSFFKPSLFVKKKSD